MNFYTVKRFLLSIVYPNRCPFCNAVTDWQGFFCPECLENARLDFYRNSGNDIFCCAYNDKSKPLIAKAKENADGYAVSAMAKLLHAALSKNNNIRKIDLIAAVPPRKAGLKARGYNLPALLAKEIAGLSGVKRCGKLLMLTREIKEQKELSAAERAENLRGAFGIKPKHVEKLKNKTVLVIDDVSTTGATLNEARRALEEAGAKEVYTAAFAKTVKE